MNTTHIGMIWHCFLSSTHRKFNRSGTSTIGRNCIDRGQYDIVRSAISLPDGKICRGFHWSISRFDASAIWEGQIYRVKHNGIYIVRNCGYLKTFLF